MMNNDRGRGGTGDRKEGKTVPRYGISPQLAPPRVSGMEKECLNSEVVSDPAKFNTKRMK